MASLYGNSRASGFGCEVLVDLHLSSGTEFSRSATDLVSLRGNKSTPHWTEASEKSLNFDGQQYFRHFHLVRLK